MKARKLLFLLFLLAVGATIESAWHVRAETGFDPLCWRTLGGHFYGPSFTFEEQRLEAIPAGAEVDVANAFGSVHVSRGETGKAAIILRKVVFASTEAEARRVADKVALTFVVQGPLARVSTNRSDLESSGTLADTGLETNLEIQVPAEAPVKVRNEHGEIGVNGVASADVDGTFEPVRVESVEKDVVVKGAHGDVQVTSVGGALTLTARHGDVSIKDVKGRVTATLEHGDASVEQVGSLSLGLKHGDAEIEDVHGDLDFRGEHSAAKAKDVSGSATVETSFDAVHLTSVKGDARVKTEHGAVEADDVQGQVRVDASFDQVNLTRISGPVTVKVEHGAVHGKDLGGGAVVEALGDDVELRDFSGPVKVAVRNAGAHLETSTPLSGPVSVTTVSGGITFETAPGGSFDLDATAHPGHVSVDLSDFRSSETTDSKVKGRTGSGGPSVTLDSTHGDVAVSSTSTRVSQDN